MKAPHARLEPGRERSRGGLAASVAIHVFLVLALAQIVFRYPIGTLIGLVPANHVTQEDVHYVRVQPTPPPASARTSSRAPAPRGGAPAPLIAPSVIPTQVPAPVPTIPTPAQAAGGTGTGAGVAGGTGIATGVVPTLPDSRIKLAPQGYFAMPTKTPSEKIDSIIADALGSYIDSLEIVSHQRKPGDWTITTKDGKKYGWDPTGIRVGKFTIPNVLFGLLPLRVQANPTLHGRLDNEQAADVLFQGRMQISEDQFKAAVKRIRERNEKLHEEQMKARSGARPDSSSS